MKSSDSSLWKSMALSLALHVAFFSFLALQVHKKPVRYWVATPVELVNIPAPQKKQEISSPQEEKKVEEPKKKEKKENPKSELIEPKKTPIKTKPKEEKKPKQEEKVAPEKPKVEEKPSSVPTKEPKENQIKTAVQSTIVPDVIDFPFPYYLNIIQKTVEKNLNPFDKPVPKQTIISFKILRNGQVQEAIISQSCGSDAVDKLALMAVLRSDPFPVLPHEYIGESLRVQYHFTFK